MSGVRDERPRGTGIRRAGPVPVNARSPAAGPGVDGSVSNALEDRKGWFEVCPALGTVFLDEIGEVDAAIQVKLLRVLQTRTFQRLGDTADRPFSGKLIAATNCDLRQALAAGRFREDFYYRLCADLLVTPSLAERLLF